MHSVYPSLPYQPRPIDPLWAPEYKWAQAHGLVTGGLVDVDEEKKWVPTSAAVPRVVYRSCMLTAAEYATLGRLLPLVVSTADYLSSHEASGWYAVVAPHTFSSRFLMGPAELGFNNERRYFVKGLVKSFGAASVVSSSRQLAGLWQQQEFPAGKPLFVRGFAKLKPESEQRIFVVRG